MDRSGRTGGLWPEPGLSFSLSKQPTRRAGSGSVVRLRGSRRGSHRRRRAVPDRGARKRNVVSPGLGSRVRPDGVSALSSHRRNGSFHRGASPGYRPPGPGLDRQGSSRCRCANPHDSNPNPGCLCSLESLLGACGATRSHGRGRPGDPARQRRTTPVRGAGGRTSHSRALRGERVAPGGPDLSRQRATDSGARSQGKACRRSAGLA